MVAPIQYPGNTTAEVSASSGIKGLLAKALAEMAKPDSVVMGLIRDGLKIAGTALVARGLVNSSLADQLVGAGATAAGVGWSWAMKYIISHWLQVAVLAPASTTRVELAAIVAELPSGEVSKAEVKTAVAASALKVFVPMLLALSLVTSACKNTPVTPASPGAAVVSTLVVGATGLACGAIPANDRAAVSLGLQAFLSLLNTDPTTAMAAAENPLSAINANLGMAWLWSAIHSQLDGLGAAGWSVYGATLMKSAVTACLQAIT